MEKPNTPKQSQTQGKHGLDPEMDNLSPSQAIKQRLCLYVCSRWKGRCAGPGWDCLLGIWGRAAITSRQCQWRRALVLIPSPNVSLRLTCLLEDGLSYSCLVGPRAYVNSSHPTALFQWRGWGGVASLWSVGGCKRSRTEF